MRIERTGGAKPLTPRVVAFLQEKLGGISLDELEGDVRRRVDYVCLNGELAVEIKTLEEDGSGRMDNLYEELRAREDWPVFLGSAPLEAFVTNTTDPEQVRRRILDRIGRAILNHLKKAEKQLAAHTKDHPHEKLVRLLILVNEDHEIYEPETVAYVLWHAVRRRDAGKLQFPHVDGVIYLTERHASVVANRLAFPIVSIEGQAIAEALWKRPVLNRVVEEWASHANVPLFEAESARNFATIDAVPDEMPLHEAWRLAYRRNPYMRTWSEEKIRDRFDEVTLVTLLAGLKAPPIQLPQEALMTSMEMFTHLTLELGERRLPAERVQPTLGRYLAAANRLNLPPAASTWLRQSLQHLSETQQDSTAAAAPK